MRKTISSVERATAVLQRLPLVGVAPRPIDLLPLLRTESLDLLWSCEAADADWTMRFGAESLSLEEAYGFRQRWRSVDLDGLLPLITPFLAPPHASESFDLIPYTLTDRWRGALADAHGLTVASALGAWPLPELMDKIKMRQWLQGMDMPVPRFFAVRRTDLRYAQLVLRLGAPFVLQLPTGSAGVGTYLIENTAGIERALAAYPEADTWIASSYVGDRTLNLHGLVTGTGDVAVSRPSVQLTNLGSIGAVFGAYAGSDFGAPAALPDEVLQRCRLVVQRLGHALATRGYRGIFGVDLAVDERSVSVLEINGRIQASTWLLGETELESGALPLLTRHVLEAYGHHTEGGSSSFPALGAQLVIRHTGPARMCLASKPQPGVYSPRNGRLLWRRDGVGLLDCGPHDVVIADLPGDRTVLEPGAALARVVSRRSLTTPDGQAFNADGRAVLSALYGALSLRPCALVRSAMGGQ